MKHKKLKISAIVLGLGVTMSSVAYAYNDITSYKISPSFKLGVWTNDARNSERIASSKATPFRSNVYLIVTGTGQLENTYKANDGRTFPIQIKDEDAAGNENDICKRYNGKFNGRYLRTVELVGVESDQAIDAKGDNEVEMYLTGKLGRISGDVELAGGTTLFYYQIAID